MLKIKDDVDLKELEKFGFTKGIKYYTNNHISIMVKRRIILFNLHDHKLTSQPYYYHSLQYNTTKYYMQNTIYKLIKSDLVEEV